MIGPAPELAAMRMRRGGRGLARPAKARAGRQAAVGLAKGNLRHASRFRFETFFACVLSGLFMQCRVKDSGCEKGMALFVPAKSTRQY